MNTATRTRRTRSEQTRRARAALRCSVIEGLEERLAALERRLAEQERRHAAEVAELQAQLAAKDRRIAELEIQLARARKTSRNSSKPPSSDIVKPPVRRHADGSPAKCRRGGQPGHPRHERPAFSDDEIDRLMDYRVDTCPCCGEQLVAPAGGDAVEVFEQVELPARPLEVTRHRRHAGWCAACGRSVVPPWPPGLVEAGLVGPRLTALIAFLKGACGLSLSALRRFLRDVCQVRVSKGFLAKLLNRVSGALAAPYEELLASLPDEPLVNVDETGHRDGGRRYWTWVFRAGLYALYRISPSRGSDVLLDVLGADFAGLLGCDYFSAYRKFARLNENVRLQFCLAHFIRDVKFLAEHPDPRNRAHAERLLTRLRRLFETIHRRDEYPTAAGFRTALARVRNELIYAATLDSPHTADSLKLEERFYRDADAYFRFIAEPAIDPTNNAAEQILRFVAVQRRLTQGTRSEAGRRWSERIWTVVGTCDVQDRSVFQFLVEIIDAHVNHRSAPSLLPPVDSSD